MRRAIDRGMVAGALALAGGVLVLGFALVRAIMPEPAPVPDALPVFGAAGPAAPQVPVASLPPAEPLSGQMIRQAANRAPFDPERRPPAQRYRLPGQRVAEALPPPEQPPVPPLRVLGTIAGPGGGIAVIQAEGEAPQVVTVGQMIGGYRVASVREEAVVVATGGWEINLALEEGNTAVLAQSDSRTGRRGAQDPQVVYQQRLESIVRSLQERLGSGARVQIEGGRAFIIGADGTRQEVQLPGNIARGARGGTIPPNNPQGQGDGAGANGAGTSGGGD